MLYKRGLIKPSKNGIDSSYKASEVFKNIAYIRKREELLTDYQESGEWSPEIDMQVDFVMVYGIDGGMPTRVRACREKGYIVHVMAGSAWGSYQDFLNGEWDGRKHGDERQTDRNGDSARRGYAVSRAERCIFRSFQQYSFHLEEKRRGRVRGR